VQGLAKPGISSAFVTVLGGLACLVGSAAAVRAADVPVNERETGPVAVTDRLRPYYDPAGIRYGGFVFLPSVATSLFYNDNVTASADKVGSAEFHIAPELKIRSDWSRHQVDVYGGVDAVRYSDAEEYDHVDAIAGAKARIDVQRDFAILPSVEFRRQLIQPGDSEALVTVDDSVMRNVLDGRLGFSKRFNRLWVAGGAAGAHVTFDGLDGVPFEESAFPDYTVGSGSLRVGYDISPMTAVFGEAVLNSRSFDEDVFDSEGYQLRGGVRFEATRLIHGEVFGGYLNQDFDDAGFEDISTYTFGGNLRWFASPLWTVWLNAAREAGVSGYGDGSSLVMSSAAFGVDYELLRNLILSGSFRYVNNAFEGVDREDERWQTRFSAKYLIDRHWNVSLDYKRTDFDTDAVDVDSYVQNVYGATLRFQY
jgi:hypothetical protein